MMIAARLVPGCAVLAGAAVLAGCAAAGPRPAAPQTARAAARHSVASTVAARVAGRSRSTGAATAACDPEASSIAPLGPPAVTPGSTMAKIRARGYLIAGVDQSTYHFGYLNPLDGQTVGFDIDMVRAVAQAIFGDPGKVEYKAIPDSQRIADILNGSVDIVAHTMTITCDRLKQVDFSAVYFMAHQRILVLKDSRVTSPKDLAGQRVCVTTGSDSGAQLGAGLPLAARPVIVSRTYWTDCLVLLQQYEVAAISTDDAILYGLAAQDPFTKVVGPALTNEPYGLAISRRHADFVRFVNAVLARDISDGGWRASYKRWVGDQVPAPPAQVYAS